MDAALGERLTLLRVASCTDRLGLLLLRLLLYGKLSH